MRKISARRTRRLRGSTGGIARRLCLVLLLLVPAAARAESASAFRAGSVDVPGEIQETLAVDLDRDGRKEIVVTRNEIRDRNVERRVDFFGWAPGPGPAELSVRASWQVHPEAVFWDIGPAGKGAGDGQCLYFLAHDGLWRLCPEGSGVSDALCVIRHPLLVAAAQEDGFPFLDFILDWDGDGRDEALLPMGREARFYRWMGPDDWQLSDVAALKPSCIYNNNILLGRKGGSYQYLTVLFYPLAKPADLNRDGRTDLLVFENGRGLPFLRNENGRLDEPGEPWDLDIRTQEEKLRRRANLSYRVADLNRDGCADVVVHKVGVKFADWDSETAIFLGKADGPPNRKADLRFPSRGFLSGVSVEDLDGDGFPDMTLWSVRMGLWPIIEILLRRVIHLESVYHYGTWPPGFSEDPQSRRDFEFRIDTARPDLVSGLVPNTEGDFDGDGLKDLVARSGDDSLGIYLGKSRKGFSFSPWMTLQDKGIAHLNHVWTGDLDGDALCDILAHEVNKGSSVLRVWTRR